MNCQQSLILQLTSSIVDIVMLLLPLNYHPTHSNHLISTSMVRLLYFGEHNNYAARHRQCQAQTNYNVIIALL